LRFINVFVAGVGTYGDIVNNVVSPMNGFWGVNNTVGARWISARVIRCGIRLIPTSPQITRAGVV